MKVSDYIMKFLEKQGSNTIFSFSGGMIAHLEDSAYLNKKIHLISVKHEQAGAFSAEGFSRSCNSMGVAMGTSGPGATNMITGIASAYFDSIPVLYITGQVNTYELTKNEFNRQTGFQETNIISMVEKITKYAHQIKDKNEIRYELEKSFYLANNGRKGPVLLDVPIDIQRAEIEDQDLISYFNSKEYLRENKIKEAIVDYDKIINLIEESRKPIILLGGGARSATTKKYITKLSKLWDIPVVTSLLGLDGFDHKNPCFLGMIGVHGNRYANIALMNADLVIVLGSRLDVRQTGALRDKFCNNAKILHVDIDKNELGYRIENTYMKVNQNIDVFLGNLLSYKLRGLHKKENWISKVQNLKSYLIKIEKKKKDGEYYNMNYFFSLLSDYLPSDTIVTNDIGENQMWSSQSLCLTGSQQLLNCGGMGAMGFSLPAAVGASFGNKGKKIISINGDGGFQLNIQELETIVHHNLPILIIVLNNNSLGMVKEFQRAYMGGRFIGTVIGYSCPNLSKIAKAYGLKYYKIKNRNINNIIKNVLQENGPTLLEVCVSFDSKVTPKMMFGCSLDNQAPELPNDVENKITKILA